VPIGVYTRQLLRRLHLSSILSSNTVSQETNVANITSKVALGSADAGFVYVTDRRAAGGKVRGISLPRWAQPPVRYSICTVRRSGADTSGAAAFIRRVRSTAGRRALKRFGFGLPPLG
jgi:molybdate transport system substrate-binding protein